MRSLIALAVTLAGLAALPTSASACSIRGRFCSYPSWAANAFEGRQGFKGNPAILTDQYVGQSPRKAVRRRK